MTRQYDHSGRMASGGVVGSSRPRCVMPHGRGLQPPPNDPRALSRELTRLAWALHCLQNSRARLVVVVDRYDQRVAKLRREIDEYSIALEAIDPERFARFEESRRELDNPKAAIEWAQGRPEEDVT